MRTTKAALLIALAVGLPACGGGGDDGQEVASRAATSTTSAPATSTTAQGGVPDGGEDAGVRAGGATGGGGSSATTAPPTTAPPTTAAGGNASGGGSSSAQQAQPAKAGTYEYDTDGETTVSGGFNRTEPMPERTTLRVDAPDGVRQRSVRDMRDGDGNGSVTTTILQYKADGVYLESLKIQSTSSGLTFSYEFRPNELISPTGVGVGYKKTFSTTSTDGGIEADVTIEVLGTERLTIGGSAVDTFKVRTTTTFTGDIEGESVSTSNLSPRHSLTVREESVTDAEYGVGVMVHSEQTSVLRSLNPT